MHLCSPSFSGALAFVAAASLVACIQPQTKIPVRPAAIAHAHPLPPVLFSPPLALASSEDAVVRVVGPEVSCSGTLVEDDLVLTAHHCVVKRGTHGEFTRDALDPSDLADRARRRLSRVGRRCTRAPIIAPPCGSSGGGGDIAILVLERKLVGMSTMTPRLDKPPHMGEIGQPDRLRPLRALAERDPPRPTAPAAGSCGTTQETFVLQASICPGDSGGPVFARGTREVVGVVSQSAMDGDERTRTRQSSRGSTSTGRCSPRPGSSPTARVRPSSRR